MFLKLVLYELWRPRSHTKESFSFLSCLSLLSCIFEDDVSYLDNRWSEQLVKKRPYLHKIRFNIPLLVSKKISNKNLAPTNQIHQGSCEPTKPPKLYNFLTSHAKGQLRPELNNWRALSTPHCTHLINLHGPKRSTWNFHMSFHYVGFSYCSYMHKWETLD